MKKILILTSAFLLMLAGCSSDDEAVNGEVNVEGGRGGVVYEGYTRQEIDESDPLSVFFGEELHNPRWDGSGNEFKTFFEQGEWNDESILVINSQEEFQKSYMGTKELPTVDFNMYTLIIGRTWGNDGSYKLNKIVLRDMGNTYELETQLLHHVGGFATAAIQTIFYWRLYPKLAQKSINPKRIVIDVNE